MTRIYETMYKGYWVWAFTPDDLAAKCRRIDRGDTQGFPREKPKPPVSRPRGSDAFPTRRH